MTCKKHPIAPYIVPIADEERSAYDKQRLRRPA